MSLQSEHLRAQANWLCGQQGTTLGPEMNRSQAGMEDSQALSVWALLSQQGGMWYEWVRGSEDGERE